MSRRSTKQRRAAKRRRAKYWTEVWLRTVRPTVINWPMILAIFRRSLPTDATGGRT